MTSKFANTLRETNNYTKTANNAVALKSTGSKTLDLFSHIGALRGTSEAEIIQKWEESFAEAPLLTLKMLFYARDIRNGGLGERRLPRIIFKHLANAHPDLIEKNMKLIPFFGRWDDLYELVETPVENKMWELMREQFEKDVADNFAGKPVSLLAKWIKSPNASSKESCALGAKTRAKLGFAGRHKIYRGLLTGLREAIRVVEASMSANRWSEIEYQGVPSKAMTNYRKAFGRHDPERFANFINAVAKGEAKINSGTLFPYDIIEKVMPNSLRGRKIYDEVLEAQWKALPNYIEGKHNVIIMADTSGSMDGRPMATALGLAIYFAERNAGAYKNMFITFSSKPSLVELKGDTLAKKLECVPAIVANTNLEAAFNLILDVAINNKVSQEEMPECMIVISDMQMDSATGCSSRYETFHRSMENKYMSAGYKMPNLVYWNVNAFMTNVQVKANCPNVQLVSGQGAATFKKVLECIGYNPYDAMLKILNSEVYSVVTL